jgi:FAD/FMN-containing dehydrogenase
VGKRLGHEQARLSDGGLTVERRRLLRSGLGAAAAMGLAACADDTSPAPPKPHRVVGSGGPGGSAAPGRAGWRAFEAALDGDVLRPGDPGYRSARRLYNPRFDPVRPAAVVRAGSTGDVVETIRFARRHHLVLVPRSGGHSYVGASTVPGGIQLDLSRLDHLARDGSRLVAGAGARLFDLHTLLDRHGRTVPTGTCPTVGATGLTLGGGVGVEARLHGLSCDALREVVVVTADGTVRTADADREPGLFWACRGGGGGSFGVVTQLTYDTFAAHDMGFFFLHFDDSDAVAVVRGWLRRTAMMPRTSWANVHLDAQPGGGINLRIVGVSLTGDGHAEAAAMEAAIGVQPTSTSLSRRSHHDGVKLLAGCSTVSDASCHLAPAGTLPREAFVAGSDVVSPSLRRSQVAAVVAHVRARGRAGAPGALILDPLGGAVAAVPAAATAFPWRRQAATAQWYVGLPGAPSAGQVSSSQSWVRGGHTAFGTASVGAYVNYVEPGRPLADYYGASFARLRRVRSTYDPDGFFHTPFTIPLS